MGWWLEAVCVCVQWLIYVFNKKSELKVHRHVVVRNFLLLNVPVVVKTPFTMSLTRKLVHVMSHCNNTAKVNSWNRGNQWYGERTYPIYTAACLLNKDKFVVSHSKSKKKKTFKKRSFTTCTWLYAIINLQYVTATVLQLLKEMVQSSAVTHCPCILPRSGYYQTEIGKSEPGISQC